MGGSSSKRSSSRRSTTRSNSNSWYPQYQTPSYAQNPQYHGPQGYQYHGNTSQSYGGSGSGRPAEQKKRLDRKYSRIDDNYHSLEQVTDALAGAGLESSNLIVGIDFTKSNEWTGGRSFQRRCLHHIGHEQNPYEQAISIIGKTLSSFDEDNLIPCFGFGDASTHDQEVFSFYPDDRFCHGFEEVLSRYRELVPQLRLAGPTSFAPIIEMAVSIVEQSGGQYHVLLIIADGQVTRSVDTERGQLSAQEKNTVEAIVKASEYPLSIILVGVGDGPCEIVVEAANSDCLHTKGMELTPVSEMAVSKSVEPGSKNRQCIAYIESKGRQCVRWANDGDVYCCVHLSSRLLGSSEKAEKLVPVDTPMCEGTTVLGTKCKHRALPGFLFCKKHRPHDETEKISHSPQSTLKRKLEENYAGSVNTCRDIVLVNSESPLEVEPVSFIGGDYFQRKSSLGENPTHPDNNYDAMKGLHCIGSPPFDDKNPCREAPKRYCLYCENHLPSWLKRARNGKSRIVSKEVFTELLRDCSSWEQKVHLHKACELFYRLFKSILSLRNPVPKDVQFQWALTEASKDTSVGEFFTKLVHSEKARIKLIWGFGDDLDVSPIMEEPPLLPSTTTDSIDNENAIKCKICSAEFSDDQALGNHWMDSHKKEAQWLFRGYACAICLDSFTNKKLLETHVQERHHVQFVEQCMLLQCIPCGSHFGNSEQLWQHVLSVHPVDLKPSKAPERQTLPAGAGQDSPVKHVQENSAPLENNSENPGVLRKFTCRFCGLKFDLLPDLGRHHQAAHMGPNLVSNHPAKKGVRYYAYRLKSGRLSRPKFKKGLAAASYRIRNRANANLKRGIQATKSLGMRDMSLQPRVTSLQPQVTTSLQPHVTETSKISKFAEHQCSGVAKILFSEIQKTKPRPNNLDILSIARTACCKVSLAASLEEKFGILPKRIYLKAAKLCAEHNIIVNWHHEGFICPRGCNGLKDQALLSPLSSLPNSFVRPKSVSVSDHASDEWELDEFHCIINSHGLKLGSLQKSSIFCDDISFGKESTPVICVVDQELLHSINKNGSNDQDTDSAMPWKSFTYVTKAMLDQSLSLDSESLQLGCSCSYSSCCPETCDHVYLFGNDYEDANDIFGKPMRGRFPYDENGRIILEEGYLVYECNRRCRCNKSCPNRILQNGVRVKLEVFKTENKGWGVRAGEAILRGTFVCEYIGEVLDVQEAHNRRKRYGTEHCSYFYDIDDHVNDMSRLIEGQAHYIIDATKYGNVSRFINHSCSPNLVNHQVLVESMDCERAHIGLYASRDIALGEELTHDYHYKLVSGEGTPCLCGASKCRGRLY